MVVYLAIKSFENSNTKICNPSLPTIAEACNASINTVRKEISILINKGCLFSERKGKMTYYSFPDYINFEMFSFDFLKMKELTFIEKGYLAASQQFMYREDGEHGIITYNNHELSKKINMPVRTITQCNQSLIKKHLLTIIQTAAKDDVGCARKAKIFNMKEYLQSVAFVVTKHELDIQRHDDDIAAIKEAIAELKKQQEADKKLVDLLIKENKKLKEQLEQKTDLVL